MLMCSTKLLIDGSERCSSYWLDINGGSSWVWRLDNKTLHNCKQVFAILTLIVCLSVHLDCVPIDCEFVRPIFLAASLACGTHGQEEGSSDDGHWSVWLIIISSFSLSSSSSSPPPLPPWASTPWPIWIRPRFPILNQKTQESVLVLFCLSRVRSLCWGATSISDSIFS